MERRPSYCDIGHLGVRVRINVGFDGDLVLAGSGSSVGACKVKSSTPNANRPKHKANNCPALLCGNYGDPKFRPLSPTLPYPTLPKLRAAVSKQL